MDIRMIYTTILWFIWLRETPTISYSRRSMFMIRLFQSPRINRIRIYGIPPYVPLPKIPPFRLIFNHNHTSTNNATNITNLELSKLNVTSSMPETILTPRVNVEFYEEQENWDSGELAWYDKIRNANPNPCNSCNSCNSCNPCNCQNNK